MYRDRGYGAARSGDDSHLRARRDIACRVDVLHRGVIALVDYEPTHLIALASKLRAQIVGGILTHREVETLAIE
jgi:hypothetical protein